jgi:SWI/SNF-related matrix-associated actin-dependent regulator 1 of chromatin subfamily A
MVPEIFDSGDINLKTIFGNRGTGEDRMEDSDLIAHMKAILGPFVLRRLKSDVMQQLVAKTQKVIDVNNHFRCLRGCLAFISCPH